MKRAITALVLLCVLPAPGRAQEPAATEDDTSDTSLPKADRPDVSIRVSQTEDVFTGDVVTLAVTVQAEAGQQVTVPEQSFSPFEVRNKNVRDERDDEGAKHLVFELELLAFEPGEHEVGPVTLRVVTAEGVIGTVETRAVTVRVGSLIANEPNAEPKPQTEPVPVTEPDYTLAWIGGGLLAIVLIILLTLLVARWWRRRKAAAAPPAPPRPAHEVALERLHALRRDRQAAEREDRLMEWVDGVSDALRQYLGGRYGFDGLESTTDEVLAHLGKVALSDTLVTEVTAVLGESDLVKFAQVSPEPKRCDELLEAAYRIVHRTKRPEHGPETEREAAA